MQLLVHGPALVLTFCLRLLNALCLTLAALLVILAGDGGHHLNEHGVDRSQHPSCELVAGGVLHALVTGRQIDGNDAQPLGINRGLQPLPVLSGQAAQAVDALDQEHVASLGITQQAQQLGAVDLGATLVLQVLSSHDESMLGRELLQVGPGAGGVLL
ncbi:hypothetical protein D3C85_393630 [compost metagenome]